MKIKDYVKFKIFYNDIEKWREWVIIELMKWDNWLDYAKVYLWKNFWWQSLTRIVPISILELTKLIYE